MDPFTVALVVTSVASSISGGRAQKRAAKANARAMREQAAFNAMVSRREADIFKHDSEIFLGSMQNTIAKSGVDFSGSTLMQYATSKTAANFQMNAIKAGAAQRASSAEQQAREALRVGKDLQTAGYLQGAGAILNATGRYYDNKLALDRNNNSQYQTDSVLQYNSPTFGQIGSD